MAKGNRKVYRCGTVDCRRGETLTQQDLDNLDLKPINRRGQPALGSRNTGHTKESPTNQSRQDYDN